ncbi:PspC domain-containing protein [Nocardiopsis ansamitocini]|nr:PspC domain-containing protein [Nocardiopsis ansamitocini]
MEDRESAAGTGQGAAPTGVAPPEGDGAERLLRKDDVNGVVTGVAAGLGRYTQTDPVVWRTTFAITALVGGTGLFLYIAAWLLMRDSRGGPAMAEQLLGVRLLGKAVVALLGVGLAVATALSLVGGFGWGTLVLATPLILSGLSAHNRGVDLQQTARDLPGWLKATGPPPAAPEPEPTASYYNPAQPWAAAPAGPVDLALVGRHAAEHNAEATEEESDEDTGSTPGWGTGSDACRKGRGASLLMAALWLVAGLSITTFVMVGGVSWSSLIAPGTGPLYLGGVVLLLGAVLVVGTWAGDGRGVKTVATVATVMAVAASTTDLTTMRFGDAPWGPSTVAQAEEGFALTAGNADIDLTGIPLEPGQELAVRARVGIGTVEVLVPESVRVVVNASSGVGEVKVGDMERYGVDNRLTETVEPVGHDPSATLVIDVRSQVGTVEVRHVAS